MTRNQGIGLVRAVCPVIVACVVAVKVVLPLAACFKGLAAILLVVFALTTIVRSFPSHAE